MKLKISHIRKTLETSLKNKGIPSNEAKIIADEYLQGELQGKKSHGLMAFPSLLERLSSTKLQRPKIIKQTHAYILIDARENLGAVVGKQAADLAITKARKEGIALALIKNQITWLRPGTLAKYIADRGFIGVVLNNGGRPMTAPPGGYDPAIGTNPIGIGIPTTKDPIIADMATSVFAWGTVREAESLGHDLPKNTFFDNKGNFAVKPKDAYSVLPAGSYKGFALGFLIEILTGSLIQRHMGTHQMAGDYRTLTRGGVILVINPSKSSNYADFITANSKLVKAIKSSHKLKGTTEIFLPGEQALKTHAKNLRQGYLEVEPDLWQKLQP